MDPSCLSERLYFEPLSAAASVSICSDAAQIGRFAGREPHAFILEASGQLISGVPVWFSFS